MTGPTFKYGDMFEEWNKAGTLFLVTANSTIDYKGHLVMGAGAAKTLNLRASKLPKVFGEKIAKKQPYGLIIFRKKQLEKKLGHWCRIFCDVGVFQVKERYRDPAKPELIEMAATMLQDWATKNPLVQIHLNMPGTGHGRLSEAKVMPLLRGLPTNVNIWRFSHEETA